MADPTLPQFGLTCEQLLSALKPNAKLRPNKQAVLEQSPHRDKSNPSPRQPVTESSYSSLGSHLGLQAQQQTLARPIMVASDPVTKRDHEWRERAEVGVKIEGLPRGVTTLDLYRCFKNEGAISRIQVPEPQFSKPSYINFSPPPSRAFFFGEDHPIVFTDPTNRRHQLICSVTRELKFRVTSPVDPDVEYDEVTRLSLDTLDFGFMQSEREYNVMHSVSTQPGRLNRLTLNLRIKKMICEFSLPEQLINRTRASQRNAERVVKYRIEIPIRDLGCIYQIGSSPDERQLLFTVANPPEFYRRTHNVEGTHDPMSTEWRDWWAWLRQTDITSDPESLHQQAISLCRADAIIDVGRWTTYRLRVSSASNERVKFDVLRRALADHNVPFYTTSNIHISHEELGHATVWEHLDPSRQVDGTSSLSLLRMEHIFLPFAVRYQLEVCLSYGIVNEHNISKEFLVSLAGLGEQRATSLLETAALLKSKLNERFYNPSEMLQLKIRKPRRKRSNGHFAYMRAAQITPTMVYYSTPVLETSNRIIRQFYAYEDRFLRVRFSDEDGKLRYKDHDIHEELFVRVRRALTEGVRIGDRHYEFLAFGNSQFRENAAYFFASTKDLKASDIRAWMGDLRDIKLVAKWAARLGQSFSTTRSIHSARVKVSTETDIIRNGYNFSDGVGKVSPFLAQLIANEFGLNTEKNACPSLFQFRMGGCKGVLVVDPTLSGSQEVVIRESQYKFPAAHEGLDVIRYSSFAASMLNRQIIILLDTLGVEPVIFLDKQKAELAELERAMSDRGTAVQLLQKRIDFNQMTLSVAGLLLDGFMDSREPFVMSILQLWRAWNIKYLKEKARITIDEGAFLLGCVDESGNLRGHYSSTQRCREIYGPDRSQWLPEIFLQVRDPPHTGPYKVRTGPCLLARNPSLHPGDLRVVRAVDVPQLHHLRDVVVLPQTGDRDIANMCSGGDLDGDDYLVIWDKELFPPQRNWNREAMDFHPPKGPALDREVNINDVQDFFVQYMKNNRLELIAVSHLAQADQNHGGVDSHKCLELAKLHSWAVDYAKSGVPARLPRELNPRRWPHFMEKDKKVSYKSSSVLGRLYDDIQLIDFEPLFESQFDERILGAYNFEDDDMASIMQKVKETKEEYDKSVRRIMAKHSISTEFEVWSTFVLGHGYDKGDYKFHEEIGNLAHSLKTQYQDEIIELAGGRTFKQLELWIAAMYKVTADEMTNALAECSQTKLVGGRERPLRQRSADEMPLISFPWIFHSELGKIATNKRDTPTTTLNVDRAASQQTVVKKMHHLKATHALDEGTVVPELDTSAGLVRAGEELKLFRDVHENEIDCQSTEPDEERVGQNRKRRMAEKLVLKDWASVSEVREALRRSEDATSNADGLFERLVSVDLDEPRASPQAALPIMLAADTKQDTKVSSTPRMAAAGGVTTPTPQASLHEPRALQHTEEKQGGHLDEDDSDDTLSGEEDAGGTSSALDRLAQMMT